VSGRATAASWPGSFRRRIGGGPIAAPAGIELVEERLPFDSRQKARKWNGTDRALGIPADRNAAVGLDLADAHGPPGMLGFGVDGNDAAGGGHALALQGVAEVLVIGGMGLG